MLGFLQPSVARTDHDLPMNAPDEAVGDVIPVRFIRTSNLEDRTAPTAA
jgi:hypothetical protein